MAGQLLPGALLAAGLAFTGAGQASTIGEQAGQPGNYINCETGSAYERLACNLVGEHLANVLTNSAIGYRDGDLMYRLDPVLPPGRLDGNGCSYQTYLETSRADVNLRSSGAFSLSGNSISSPVVLAVNLPVSVEADLGLREVQGLRIPFTGICAPIWMDRYTVAAGLETVSSNMLLFSLEPQFRYLEDGEYAVIIKPELAVFSEIEEAVPSFRISGKSHFLSAFSAFALSLPNLVSNLLEAPFTEQTLAGAFQNLALDLGVGAVSSGLFLNDAIAVTGLNVMDAVIDAYLARQLEDSVNQGVGNLTRALEESLQASVAAALGLGPSGDFVFVLVPSRGGNLVPDGALVATEAEHAAAGRAYSVEMGDGLVEFYANGSHDFIGRHRDGEPEVRSTVALLEAAPGHFEFAPREWYGTCANHYNAGRATMNWLGRVEFKQSGEVCGNYTHTRLMYVTESARYYYGGARAGSELEALDVPADAVRVLEH